MARAEHSVLRAVVLRADMWGTMSPLSKAYYGLSKCASIALMY
jgi:hypothetical protein